MATLQITFKGTDEVSTVAQKITLEVEQVGDASEKAAPKGKGFFSGMLESASGFLAANVVGQISGQISSFVGNAFADAKETQVLMGQTAAVIQSTGGAAGKSSQEIADLASSLSDAAGQSLFGDDQIQQAENLFLTFTNIKGAVFDAATAISVDMAQALGGEPKAQAIQLGKALNDPIQGISALSRVGVTFTDEQKKQIKAMQDAGNMAGAQKVILDELNKEFGGSAKAAAAATGGWSEFKGRLGEAGETMATAVLPLLGKIGSLLLDNVMPVIEGAANAVSTLASAFQTGAADGGGFVGGLSNMLYSLDTISPLFDTLGDLVNAAAAAFGDANDPIDGFVQTLTSISPTFALLKAAVDAAVPPIKDIVLSVFGIIQDFLQEHGDKIKADLTGAWKQIQDIINAVIPPIQAIVSSIFGAIATFLHAHGDDIKSFLGQTWDQIAQIIRLALDLIKAIIVPVLQFIAKYISDHGADIQRILSAAWDGIKAIIDGALTLIKGVITVALDLIHGDWSQAWEDIKAMSARVVEDLWTILKNGVAIIVTLLGDLPAKVAGVGEAVVQAIWDGIAAKWDDLVKWFSEKLQKLKDMLPFSEPKDASSPLRGLSKAGQAIVKNIQDGIGTAPDLAVGAPLIGGTQAVRGQLRGGGGGGSGGAGGVHTVRVVVDDRGADWLKKLIDVQIDTRLGQAGNKSLSRQRAGG